MYHIKNNPNYKLYYSLTLSIFIAKELSPDLLNNNLGNFKLENIFKEHLFLPEPSLLRCSAAASLARRQDPAGADGRAS